MELDHRPFKIFASIADIHIGNKTVSPESLKKQLKTHFIGVLKQMKYLDGIFVLGDMLHTIISLNSEYSEVYYWLVGQIYKIAKKKHATVLIIKGTKSHDNDQLNNIKHYQSNDDGVDFRVYDTMEEIILWEDYKVLILPDNKLIKEDKVRLDKMLETDNKYDLILGHGLIDTMQYMVQESENMSANTYVYDVDRLVAASKGPVQFGHIHQYREYRNKFYYAGPFTLLERGGTSAGFLVTGISNDDRTKYKVELVENPDTAHFVEINVTNKILVEYPINDLIEAIDEIIDDCKPNDLITIRVTRGDEHDSAERVLLMEERYRIDKRVSFVKKVISKAESEREEEFKERKAKYHYCMDANQTTAEVLYQYYLTDILPSLPEQQRLKKTLTLQHFQDVLGSRHS